MQLPMSRETVNVRIRGRGETTIEAQFQDAELVGSFKARVFGAQLGEGKQCRLIAAGKELHDTQEMGVYRIQDGSCLHVMIGPGKSAARAARPIIVAGVQPQQAVSGGAGFSILCTLTLGMLVVFWALFLVWPELFSAEATVLLSLLTCLQLTVLLPHIKSAVVSALGACRWTPSFQRPRLSPRRRQ